MKKSDEIRRKTGMMIAKNLIVLVALVSVAFVGVFSWFTKSTSAIADGISVSCEIPEGLEIAIVSPGGEAPRDADFKDSSFNITSEEYSFFAGLNMKEVTGNGLSFINPPLTQISSVAKIDDIDLTSKKWAVSNISTAANTQYMSFDLYMRVKATADTSTSSTVSLNQNTYCGPLNPNEDFGNNVAGYSQHSVIGAARLSVYDTNGITPAQKLLWIPAPHLYYDGITVHTNETNTSNTDGLYYTDGLGQTQYVYQTGTYNHSYATYDSSGPTPTLTYNTINYGDDPTSDVTANTQKDFLLHKDVSIAQLSDTVQYTNSANETSDYYQNKVRVNVWIEGQDTESRALQVGGEFKMILSFGLS